MTTTTEKAREFYYSLPEVEKRLMIMDLYSTLNDTDKARLFDAVKQLSATQKQARVKM